MGLIAVLVVISAVLCQCDYLSSVILMFVVVMVIYKKRLSSFIYIYAALFLCTYLYYESHSFSRIVTQFDEQSDIKINTTGYFTTQFKVDGNLMMGDIIIDNDTYKFVYRIKEEAEQLRLKRGMLIYQRCTFSSAAESPLPNTNQPGFHYDEYLYYGTYKGMLTIDDIDFASCRQQALTILDGIRLYRYHLGEQMVHLKYGAYITALTTGDTRYLDHKTLNDLKTLGIYHLYAISGSHVALVTVQLYYLFKRLYIPLHISRLMILIILPGYVILTGEAPAVVRAALFMAFVLVKPRFISMLDALAITFIINLIMAPFVIFNVGFQLSYIICFSFIFILQSYELTPIKLFLLTNFISQVAALPILFYHFNIVYFIGLLTNLLFIPLFSFIIFPLCTFILLCLMLFNFTPEILDVITHYAFLLHDICVEIFLSLHALPLVIKSQHIIYYVIMIGVIYYLFHQKPRIQVIAICLCSVLILIGRIQNEDALHVLDVGQGDCIVIEYNGRVVMVDTGGKFDFNEGWEKRKDARSISEKIIIPFLYHKGITQIDDLILTHPDLDHIGEAEQLIKLKLVKRIIMNKTAASIPKYASLQMIAHQYNVPIFDESEVKIAGIDLITASEGDDINDESIVTFIRGEKVNALLTGDLSKAQEEEVLAHISSRIDVVKIGHHGSDTSTGDALLKREFKTAMISAGRNNRYGHPHEETIKRLIEYNKQIYNTQSDGRITVKLDQSEISTMRKELKDNK